MAATALSPTLSSYPGGVSKETRPWFGEQVVPQAQFAAARSDMVRGVFLRVGFWRSHAGVCTCVCSSMTVWRESFVPRGVLVRCGAAQIY